MKIKVTDQRQSSWAPINSSTRKDPLSSYGLQQAAPSVSIWVGCLSEHFKLWGLRLPGLNYRDLSLIKAWLLPIDENNLKGVFYW